MAGNNRKKTNTGYCQCCADTRGSYCPRYENFEWLCICGFVYFLGLVIKSAKSPLKYVAGGKACEETTFLSPDSRQKHKLRSNLETALGRVT